MYMPIGIYFLEPDTSWISDLEAFFLVAPEFEIAGSSGFLSDCLNAVKANPSIRCVVISQNMHDSNCFDAAKALSVFPVKILITPDRNTDTATINKLEQSGDYRCLTKPYTYTELIDTLKTYLMAPVRTENPANINEAAAISVTNTDEKENEKEQMSPVYSQNTQPVASEATVPDYVRSDNPYMANYNDSQPAIDVQDRLRTIRREYTPETNRIVPQQVITVHNQKGGVGKSTISMDLAVALHKLPLRKNGETVHAKVCLCDFDLDGSDLALLLNFNIHSPKNSGTFSNDLKMESKRISASKGTAEPIENVRFLPRDIMENYLQLHEPTGIYVLTAPNEKRISTTMHQEEIKAMLANLKACDFDFIVVDTGPNILDYTIASLMIADTLLAVTPCEITGLSRLTNIIKDLRQTPGFNPTKIKLIVNKYDVRTSISPEEVEKTLQIESYGVVPLFSDIINIHNYGYTAFNNGTKVNPNDLRRYQEAIIAIAKRLIGVSDRTPRLKEERTKEGFLSKLFKRR